MPRTNPGSVKKTGEKSAQAKGRWLRRTNVAQHPRRSGKKAARTAAFFLVPSHFLVLRLQAVWFSRASITSNGTPGVSLEARITSEVRTLATLGAAVN